MSKMKYIHKFPNYIGIMQSLIFRCINAQTSIHSNANFIYALS